MRDTYRLVPAALTVMAVILPSVGAAQQRSFSEGPLPCPSASERFKWFLTDVGGPLTLLETVAVAGVSQALDLPREWQGDRGFGQRVASVAGENVFAGSASYGLSEVFHEDTRFTLSRRHGVLPRLMDSASRSVTARRRDGRRTLSVARLGGHVAGGASLLLWYPDSYHARDTWTFAATSVAASAVADVIREFVIRR